MGRLTFGNTGTQTDHSMRTCGLLRASLGIICLIVGCTEAARSAWEILGVGKGATPAEIRRAYHKKSLQWHPDKHPDNKAAAQKKFVEIAQAYEQLTSKPGASGMPSGGEEVDLEEAMKLFEGFLKDLKDLNVEEALASFGEPDPAKQGIGEWIFKGVLRRVAPTVLNFVSDPENIEWVKKNVKIEMEAASDESDDL